MKDGASLADAEQEFLLAIYRRAVDFYQPKIEMKTGIILGDIAVWDYSRLHDHIVNPPTLRLACAIRRLLFRRNVDRLLEQTRLAYEQRARKASAAYYRNGIYVSFSSGTVHEDAVAAVVVHELSHALWERIARQPPMWRPKPHLFEKYTLFSEGFATYAERIWFIDLYPVKVRQYVKRALDTQSVYYKGLRKVQSLVKQFGPEILSQIPRRWQSFE